MPSNFREDELVKVQGKQYPVVGGRLRLAHDENKVLSVQTTIIEYNQDKAVIQATVTKETGSFTGFGMASVTRDMKLKNAILELAETRAIARALRFAGYGVEYTGFEELPDEDKAKPDKKNNAPKSNPVINDQQIEEIIILAATKGMRLNDILKGTKAHYKKGNLNELTTDEYIDLKDRFSKLPNKPVEDGK